MNSARVAGGAAPLPEHSILPEPQSPVRQENFPEESVVQRVLPQNLPDQPDGARTVRDSPLLRAKPVVERGVEPAPERSPGQTGYSQLFVKVKEAQRTSEDCRRQLENRKTVLPKNSRGLDVYLMLAREGRSRGIRSICRPLAKQEEELSARERVQ